MNPGKVTNQILERSVIKNIKKRRKDVISGSKIGLDCAVVKGDDYIFLSTNPVICGLEYCDYAVDRAVNNIAVMGGEPVGILVNITYQRDFNESTLKHIMKKLDARCEQLNVQIVGGHTGISAMVKEPIINITGIGKSKEMKTSIPYKVKGTEDIVVTKDIGMMGVNMIADLKEDKILERYSKIFAEEIKYKAADMSIVPEAAVAIKHGVTAMHDISEGGIFSALWDISEACHTGFEVDIKKIPVKQSTIEVCELFDINPYYLLSGGALIIITPDGKGLVDKLSKEDIPATIIGRVIDTNDKLINNGEEIRYLDTPKRDEIYSII